MLGLATTMPGLADCAHAPDGPMLFRMASSAYCVSVASQLFRLAVARGFSRASAMTNAGLRASANST